MRRPITIVHLIDALLLAGTEMALYKLVASMDRGCFRNVVISFSDDEPVGPMLRLTGAEVYALGMRRGRPSPAAFARLLRLIRRERPAVLQTWLYNADLVGVVAGRLLHLPNVVWNIRNARLDTHDWSPITMLAMRACISLSHLPTAIISNTEVGLADHLRMGYRPRHAIVIPNGFDLDAYAPSPEARRTVREELGINEEAILIGVVGRLHPMKGFGTFLRAAQTLSKRRPEVHYLMAGTGLTRDNKELVLADQPQLDRLVHMIGPRTDVALIMAALDIFTLPSHNSEGFPNVLGEAMACEVPCVITETAGDAPIILGDTGLVVPPRDPSALADAWEYLIGSGRDFRQALGRAARKRIQEKYALPAVTKQYEAFYLSLAAKGCG